MHESQMPSRRHFLKLSAVGAAASALAAPAARGSGPASSSANAKNLIFLVVDGMSNGALSWAHHWKLRQGGEPLHWIKLLGRDGLHRALMDTASANSPVTDSAAASSAWGCGRRVNNGSICVAPDGTELKPLMTLAKQAGKRAGLVTTCRVSHATPAGFAAQVRSRGQEREIVRQYHAGGIDLLLGGGAQYFKQKQHDAAAVDYLKAFQTKGYTVVADRAGLKSAAGGGGLLGLFAESHMPYAIDRKNDPALEGVPGLGEMFQAALARLGNAPQGFVLQVEAGRVDHAAHGNDAAAVLHDLLEFDECLPIALDFIESNPDTLLIVTTDHGTGGCQLDGHGAGYLDSGPALDRAGRLAHSFEWLQARFEGPGGYRPGLIEKAYGIRPTAEQSAKVVAGMKRRETYLSGTLIDAFGKQLTEMTAVGWTSHVHTAECVDLLAVGPGAEQVPAFLRNDELFGVMTTALGLKP